MSDEASVVDRAYERIKARSVAFSFKPGERINEVALAGDLGVSRTPLREALNRLVAEQLIDFRPGKGFFCRELDVQAVFALYELRAVLEVAAVRVACERATDERIAEVKAALYAEGLSYQGRTIREVTEYDEAFHIGLAELSGNREFVRQLQQINERIRFIRWVDMASRVGTTKGEHKAIMAAVEARDADEAARIMHGHIEKRMDQVVAAVREGYSSLYTAGPEELFERRVDLVETGA